MLEVLDRNFTARRTLWTQPPVSLHTPEILFLDTRLHPAPDFAEAILVEELDGYRIETVGSEGRGPLFRLDEPIPLSHLRFGGGGGIVVGESTVTVRATSERFEGLLNERGEDIICLGGAFELRRSPRNLVKGVVSIRETAGHSRLIFTPGIMDVESLAILCYLGIDLFDSSFLIYQSARGKVLLPDGSIDVSEADWLLPDPSPEKLLFFNLESAWKELQRVRWAIGKGRLRELVEARVLSNPWAVAILRLFDIEHYGHQEEVAPVVGGSVRCNSKQSLLRPDVQRWRERMQTRYRPPDHKRVLLLLPCSAHKPYSESRSHRAFGRVIDTVRRTHIVHEVIVTSPLGIVPRELELFFPAAHYDIPVTGHWDCFERYMIVEMLKHLGSFGYDDVICHMEEDFVTDSLDCTVTTSGDPTSAENLSALGQALEEVCRDLDPVSRVKDIVSTMGSVAGFQFGKGGERLLDGAEVSGRYPRYRIVAEGKQLGMLTPERGMISLTIEGAKRLHDGGINLVRIGDFQFKGNLFAVGVEDADLAIRAGDEAIILRGEEVVGVGVAQMSGREMIELSRGEAVRVRHVS